MKFSKRPECLCMQELNISLLLLRLAPSRLYKIWNFSFKHILHFFEVGLNFVDLSLSLQVTVCAIPLSFSFQTWLLRLVLDLPLGQFMSVV